MGYWLAEFEDQIVVRQLELHPRNPPVMFTTLDRVSFHMKPCIVSQRFQFSKFTIYYFVCLLYVLGGCLVSVVHIYE